MLYKRLKACIIPESLFVGLPDFFVVAEFGKYVKFCHRKLKSARPKPGCCDYLLIVGYSPVINSASKYPPSCQIELYTGV